MFSRRFQRQVIITRHAAERMMARNVTHDEVLRIVDTGLVRYSDSVRFWACLEVP